MLRLVLSGTVGAGSRGRHGQVEHLPQLPMAVITPAGVAIGLSQGEPYGHILWCHVLQPR